MACVYLLCDADSSLYKIGMTRGSVEKRIKKLQTGNGNDIFLVDYYETEYPFFIENTLHQRHWPEHKLNEWFKLTDKSVFNFKDECKKIEQMIIDLKDNPFIKNKLR